MKTINLARSEYSDVNYIIHHFPDGQSQLEITDHLLNLRDEVRVICRLCTGDDIFILLQLDDILRRNGIKYNLCITYLIAGRCDRLFSYGQAITIRLVTYLLSKLYCNKIDILEPHSNKSIDGNNISGITNYMLKCIDIEYPCNIALPDKGSFDRSFDFIKGGVILCSKIRDPKTGRLSGFKIDDKINYIEGLPIYLVDDLCDGGGTFLGLAYKLRELNPKSLNLMVTHMIQKDGLAKVSKVYDRVYTTNSYNDFDIDCEINKLYSNVTIIDVLNGEWIYG